MSPDVISPPTPPAPVLPTAPAAPPMFGTPQAPGKKPSPKASQPTFLGAGLFANPSNTGQKTLLGQ